MEFEKVWSDIISKIKDNSVIFTLRYRKKNAIEEIKESGLMVVTKGEPKLVKKEWVRAAWYALNEKKEISADDIPGIARYRSSFIMALLVQLEYVRYKTNPITLYIVNENS